MAHPLDVGVILECTRLAFADRMTFPEAAAALRKIGVERYVADLARLEKTHYSSAGGAVTDPLPLTEVPVVPAAFSAEAVAEAVRGSQRRDLTYPAFLRSIMSVGCVSYSVYLTGGCAIYFGRRGDLHVERFPPVD